MMAMYKSQASDGYNREFCMKIDTDVANTCVMMLQVNAQLEKVMGIKCDVNTEWKSHKHGTNRIQSTEQRDKQRQTQNKKYTPW